MQIYKTTNLITKKIYIGQEVIIDDNCNYLGSGIYLLKSIKKYGIKNFVKEIIESNILDKEKLNEREIFWINYFDAKNPKIGYNIANGGQGGNILSQELLDKRGETISKKKKGKSISNEHKEKIKLGLKKYKKPTKEGKFSGNKNPFWGKKHTGDLTRFITRTGITASNAKKLMDNLGNIYTSTYAAGLQFPNPDTARRAISDVCRGIRESYRGKTFKYI